VVRHEGFRRLKLLGKLFCLVGFFGYFVLYGSVLFLPVEGSRQSGLLLFVLPWLSYFAVLGLIAWCGAWVAEGFVSKSKEEGPT
jgi:hypothetical protein